MVWTLHPECSEANKPLYLYMYSLIFVRGLAFHSISRFLLKNYITGIGRDSSKSVTNSSQLKPTRCHTYAILETTKLPSLVARRTLNQRRRYA